MQYISYVRWLVTGVGASIVFSGWVFAQINEEINARSDLYSMDQSFFKLPNGRNIGSTAGIALDNDGSSIWTFDRCGDNWCFDSMFAPIQKFDASGNLVLSFGADMFVRPHGIHIDPEGNVWVTDAELSLIHI